MSTIKVPTGPNLKPGIVESHGVNRDTLALEEQLERIPNIMEFNQIHFDWSARVLVDGFFNNPRISEEKRGRYFMYTCTDPSLGLPVNQTFTKLKRPCVYGDAFMFRLKEPGFSKSGRVRYAEIGSARDYEEANEIILGLVSDSDRAETSRGRTGR